MSNYLTDITDRLYERTTIGVSKGRGDVLTNVALTEDKAVLSYHLLLQRKRKVYVSQLLIDNGSAHLDDQTGMQSMHQLLRTR